MRLALAVALCLAPPAGAQPPAKPFQATGRLGVPAPVGHETFVAGSNERIETGTMREVTIHSAELALAFPNRHEIVVAAATEKLLILRGSIANPEHKSTVSASSDDVIGLRLWQRYTGTGKFTFVHHYDPETLRLLSAELKPGASAKFVAVWRIPADFTDFRLAITRGRATKIAWFDFGPVIRKIESPFAPDGITPVATATAAAGSVIPMDGLELRVGPAGELKSDSAAKRLYAVDVQVTNRLLLPARWGWQYLTAELIAASAAVKAYPSITDRTTNQPWSGDLRPGASMNARFLFYSDAPLSPRALRLKMNESGRTVEAALR